MKAREITEAGKEALRSGKYQMVRINYANPDMVGHCGDLTAAIQACATVDKCLGELLAVVDEVNGRWVPARCCAAVLMLSQDVMCDCCHQGVRGIPHACVCPSLSPLLCDTHTLPQTPR